MARPGGGLRCGRRHRHQTLATALAAPGCAASMARVPVETTSARVAAEGRQDELAAARAAEAEAWGRYHALRRRKVVRIALAVAGLRDRARRGRTPSAPVAEAPRDGAAHAPPPPSPARPAAPAAPEPEVAHPWPLGHFYSPVPDTVALAREPDHARVWPADEPELPGIDWRADAQVALLEELAAQERLAFPDGPTGDPAVYHTGNEMFSAVDAWALQAMLRRVRPGRLLEVGCGWSSLVTAQVNREVLGRAVAVTCIEPYPPDFLAGGVDGIGEVLPVRVQDVPLERFTALEAGDVLFIDSSHVVKTGSDARFLYHEVLPRLRPGVVVHVHDIFLPREYPEDWVLSGRGWNEQYVLQSFLAHNAAFEVLLGMAWAIRARPELLAPAGFTPGSARRAGAGSFWMRRAA